MLFRSARLGSVFGPWERASGVRDSLSATLQMLKLAQRGEDIRMPPVEPRRDWIYSRDVAAGLVSLLRAQALRHRFYHVASGRTWPDFHAAWCARLRTLFPGLRAQVAPSAAEANVAFLGNRDRAPMSAARIAEDTGIRAQYDRDRAFDDYLQWLGAHENYWRS